MVTMPSEAADDYTLVHNLLKQGMDCLRINCAHDDASAWLRIERGTLGMARTSDPNSANSQFFITFAPARFLDRQYTVWGRVIEGMEYVDLIKKAPRGDQSGMVRDPDKIISLKVEADVK